MDKLVIEGGVSLAGEIACSGSKNAALPALAACLLSAKPVTLNRIPQVRDIGTMLNLIAHTGAEVSQRDGRVTICAGEIKFPEAPYELVKTMRASSLVLGPLVARCGRARVSLPGGCAIGARPINLHVAGLERLGAEVRQEHGYIEANAPHGLQGAQVQFDRITVTGTEDLLMAAVLAHGETVIENAAREPEVADLADLLNRMGARIEGAGTSTIRVQGVAAVGGTEHTIIPDRIEAGTFLIGGALTRGDLTVRGCVPEHLRALIAKLQQCGVEVTELAPDTLRVRVTGRLKNVDITTEEHPGFATDLQAQFMALMTIASGASVIRETVFESRFMHVPELGRLGANISLQGSTALVRGVERLHGAEVMATDLRASVSLVLAALVAEGETTVHRIYHLDRGYESLDRNLVQCGADIQRVAG